jgi:predicted nucleic acid-binding protein
MIILDTNVLSESLRPEPAAAVRLWMSAQVATSLFTTCICEAEMRYGVTLLPRGRRRVALEEAVRTIFSQDFADRVLPFDSAAATCFAEIAAARRTRGRPIADLDAQIASIARSRGAMLATRNAADFADCGVKIVSPWG